MTLLLLACTASAPDSGPEVDVDTDTDADSDTDADTDADTDIEPWACADWPEPGGPVHAVDSSMSQDAIQAVFDAAVTGDTVEFADGSYAIEGYGLAVRVDGLTLRSASRSRTKVVLDGSDGTGNVLSVQASDVVLTELTIQNSWWHPVHITPSGEDLAGVVLYDVHVADPGQQAVKVNTDGNGHVVDDGLIACSAITMSAQGRSRVRDNCYTGGVDAHQARGWVVRDNTISGFWCEEGLSEHGVHFWQGSRDTQVLRNYLIDNARGIGFGLYEVEPDGRTYDDAPCADGAGHYGGRIENNAMFNGTQPLFDSASGMDGGIALASACGAEILHNTVFGIDEPFAAIEYRFSRSDPLVRNNFTSHKLYPRDAGAYTEEGNLEGATLDDFRTERLDIVAGSAANDAGVAGSTSHDWEGDERSADTPDVGADER